MQKGTKHRVSFAEKLRNKTAQRGVVFVNVSYPFERQMRVAATIFIAAIAATAAQAQGAPRLQGRIETDPMLGLLRGDVCLLDLTQQRTQSFLLNRGLNIREVRDAGSHKVLSVIPKGYADSVSVGEATRYTVENAGTAGYCVSYVGAFPVFHVDDGERSLEDWKGQIAFDGRTIRATEQSRFYPAPIEATGAAIDRFAYELDVVCEGCAAIYVNGSPPRPGPRARFSSATPRQLMLYAGRFPYSGKSEALFIGADVDPSDAKAIQTGVRAIADVHSAYFELPYNDAPAFLTFANTSQNGAMGKTTWQFVTWPTVAMDGRVPFSQLLHGVNGRRVLPPDRFLAHEMAHYFFGSLYIPRGPLRWFLLESTAEFLGLRAYRVLAGDAAYRQVLRRHFEDAKSAGALVPLDEVQSMETIGVPYRYKLGPLLLVALESYTSADVVRKMLRNLVIDRPSTELSYIDLRRRLIAAGATESSIAQWEKDCLHAPLATGCLSTLPDLRIGSD